MIASFQLHFVKTGLVDVEAAQIVPRAFAKRQMTDYADFATVTAEEVEIRVAVDTFVGECVRVLVPGQ